MNKVTKAQMTKKGFVHSKDIEERARIIMSIEGLEKKGKTHFSFTAPGPIALYSTDIGEEGVISKFPDKDIWVMPIDKIDDNHAEEAPKEIEKFKSSYTDMLKGTDVRTIILDTATEIWEILRMARFGRLTQIMPYQYGPVNAEYRAIIREAYNYDKNVILLHKMKQKYVDDKRTDEYERAGFADTGFLVQMNIQAIRYPPEEGGEFSIYIKDCRQNPELAGEEFDGEAMCNFPFMASMALPNVDPKAWE